MKYLRAVNRKAARVEESAAEYSDVFALQSPPSNIPSPRPHYPPGCSLAFSPGWETDVTGGTAGFWAPAERGLDDWYLWWSSPADRPRPPKWYSALATKGGERTQNWGHIATWLPGTVESNA